TTLAARHPVTLAAWLPWLWLRRPATRSPRAIASVFAWRLVNDAVVFASIVKASARNRTIVLSRRDPGPVRQPLLPAAPPRRLRSLLRRCRQPARRARSRRGRAHVRPASRRRSRSARRAEWSGAGVARPDPLSRPRRRVGAAEPARAMADRAPQPARDQRRARPAPARRRVGLAARRAVAWHRRGDRGPQRAPRVRGVRRLAELLDRARPVAARLAPRPASGRPCRRRAVAGADGDPRSRH